MCISYEKEVVVVETRLVRWMREGREKEGGGGGDGERRKREREQE